MVVVTLLIVMWSVNFGVSLYTLHLLRKLAPGAVVVLPGAPLPDPSLVPGGEVK